MDEERPVGNEFERLSDQLTDLSHLASKEASPIGEASLFWGREVMNGVVAAAC
jgi:hypothetical protein